MMRLFKALFLLCVSLGFSGKLISAESEPAAFTEVYKLVESSNTDIYLITDTGTWLLDNDKLIRVDSKSSVEAVSVDAKPYKGVIAKANVEFKSAWQRFVGVSSILIVVIFVGIYLYYQSALNKRRRAYYERMKIQQQVLSISSLATGDEVLDCDIMNNTINRINKNATIGLPDKVYFQSEAFIETLHPDDKSVFLGHFESLMQGGKNNYEIEYRISGKEQEWVWLVERGCVIERDDKGKAKRLVSSMRDISSIKQEHENLVRLISELELRLKSAEAALNN
ncbi:PAS domain-containing protein [Psychrosphaera saromensis]|nr:PAS domain-containing protein [Psychrosphaera saromensis]